MKKRFGFYAGGTPALPLLGLLLMASVVIVSCGREEERVYTMSVDATKGGGAKQLDLVGSTLTASWATSEHVYVQKGSAWASGALQPQAPGESATLKGTLSGISINAGDVLALQFPRSGDRDYGGQVGTLADIAARYDYATATVTVGSIDAGGNIGTAGIADFENHQAIVKFTLLDTAGAALDASLLTVDDGTRTYTVTPTAATHVLFVAIPGFADQPVTLDASIAGKRYTYTRNNVTFTNGRYYEINVKLSPVEGSLAGRFSVSASKQVYFSQGNLQQSGSAFEATQYAGGGLFAWSDESRTIGGDTWRMLSSEEWDYLLNRRDGPRFAKARLCDAIQGVILLPDHYVHPAGLAAIEGVNETGNTSWDANQYTSAQWALIEAAGAVFLPAAGYSGGAIGSEGHYWSSTPYGDNQAKRLYFSQTELTASNAQDKTYSCSLRLAKEAN